MGTFSGILKVPVPPENFMKKYLQIIWLIICGLSICCAPWEYSFARESENLDEIIQGFEEEEQKHDDELEDLMEDFKDETPEGEKKDAEEKDDVLEGFDEDTLEKAVEKEETEEKPSTWRRKSFPNPGRARSVPGGTMIWSILCAEGTIIPVKFWIAMKRSCNSETRLSRAA
jgi:hypothetical protein